MEALSLLCPEAVCVYLSPIYIPGALGERFSWIVSGIEGWEICMISKDVKVKDSKNRRPCLPLS